MDVFVFLLGGVHFLLFLLLAALEIASEVEVRTLADGLKGGDVAALEDNSAVRAVD